MRIKRNDDWWWCQWRVGRMLFYVRRFPKTWKNSGSETTARKGEGMEEARRIPEGLTEREQIVYRVGVLDYMIEFTFQAGESVSVQRKDNESVREMLEERRKLLENLKQSPDWDVAVSEAHAVIDEAMKLRLAEQAICGCLGGDDCVCQR